MAAAQEATAGRLPAQDSGSRCLLSGADEQRPGAAAEGRTDDQGCQQRANAGSLLPTGAMLVKLSGAPVGHERPAAPDR